MVFSGIVEEMGVVESLVHRDDIVLWDGSKGEGTELTITCKVALGECYIGASISVNGTCLTATSFNESSFTVGLAPET
jgi:riboflavin synthase